MKKNKPKIGIINGGGDCPGINTVIDTIVKNLEQDYQILGFIKGYEGLYYNQYINLTSEITNQYKFVGGTFLKTVNHGHFAGKIGYGQKNKPAEKNIKILKENSQKLNLESLIVIGGDGTLSVANWLVEDGFKIIAIPKSIDNDLDKTLYTFGFLTSVEIATDSIDKLETTAYSHDRVMILEVMGRNSGWIALYSGIAGGANIILIPEIPFEYQNIVNFLEKRNKKNSLIVVAEGAKSGLNKKNIVKNFSSSEVVYGGIGEELASFINNNSYLEARSTQLGHIQRGGSPNAMDRILSRQFAIEAVKCIRQKIYGKMVSFSGKSFNLIDISKSVNKIKLVNKNNSLFLNAKNMGIYFGD